MGAIAFLTRTPRVVAQRGVRAAGRERSFDRNRIGSEPNRSCETPSAEHARHAADCELHASLKIISAARLRTTARRGQSGEWWTERTSRFKVQLAVSRVTGRVQQRASRNSLFGSDPMRFRSKPIVPDQRHGRHAAPPPVVFGSGMRSHPSWAGRRRHPRGANWAVARWFWASGPSPAGCADTKAEPNVRS